MNGLLKARRTSLLMVLCERTRRAGGDASPIGWPDHHVEYFSLREVVTEVVSKDLSSNSTRGLMDLILLPGDCMGASGPTSAAALYLSETQYNCLLQLVCSFRVASMCSCRFLKLNFS